MEYYVRCRYCDDEEDYDNSLIDFTELPNEKGCKHKRVMWNCVNCCWENISFVFPEIK